MRRAVTLVLAAALACGGPADRVRVTIETPSGRFAISAELADTPAERARGLMERARLEPAHGMLFLFDDEPAVRQFHMLNTLIPLDLVSIRAGRVVGIQRMVPCDDPAACDEPITRTPPADAAIELNAGTAERARIRLGALVSYEGLP